GLAGARHLPRGGPPRRRALRRPSARIAARAGEAGTQEARQGAGAAVVGRGGAGFVRLILGALASASALALALLLPSLAVACGGGGGGSPTEPPPTPTPMASVTPTPTPTPTPGTGITFTAASTGPGIVLAQGAGTSSSSLTVDVRAEQVTGLYGVAFDLDYPPAPLHP